MRTITLLFVLLSTVGLAQPDEWSAYEASKEHSYGQPNPEAPESVTDFALMMGLCKCKSLRRNPDQTWADTTEMWWQFEYILNGTAVQDRTWSDGSYATSIRQFHPDSNMWVVGYNSWPGVGTKGLVWKGQKEGADIVLKQPQVAPNGMKGISRLTFTNMGDHGWDWRGEWINEEKGIVYPFWLIWCRR